jgi:outer membrane protein assembly factor BamD (BamD/ComL family)
MSNKLAFLLLSPLIFLGRPVLGASVAQKDHITTEDPIIVKKVRKTRKEKKQAKRQKCRSAVKYKLVSKAIRDQDEFELRNNFAIYLELGNDDLAVKYLEALIAKINDFAQIRDLRLQLADLYFKNEQYLKAGSIYTEYYESYPGYTKAEYALSQAIAAKFKQMGACDQDNVITHEILELARSYLQNKSYKKYRQTVLDLFESCNNQLFEAEVIVFEHYFRQGFLVSAQRRLDYMNEKILPKMPQVKNRIDALQNLVEQAKLGKNPLKLLKRMHNVEKTQHIERIDRETALQINKQKPYASQF